MAQTQIEVFDLEAYPNLFTIVFYNRSNRTKKTFVIFADPKESNDINDYNPLMKFLEGNKYFVGYNSTYYDMQMLEYLTQYIHIFKNSKSSEICKSLYNLSVSIINNGFKGFVYCNNFKHFDLMKIGGGNGLKKSLKSVACNLKQPLIQDLPIRYDKFINADEVDKIVKYNNKDVDDTDALFSNLLPKIVNRVNTFEKFKVYVMNDTDSGVANKLLEHFYVERTGESIEAVKSRRVFPKKVLVKDCIPDDLVIHNKKIKDFINKIADLEIDTTKSKITIENAPILDFGGISYQIGAGGLHSIDSGAMFESDEEWTYRDADVSSYYPKLMVNKFLKPRHLSDDFIYIVEYLMEHRLKAKKEGDTSTADIFKIVINSLFGKTGSKHSWLYDPLNMLKTTIGGQMYLLQLIDWLYLAEIPVISANTDGIICKVHKDLEKAYKATVEEWEVKTKFNLDFIDYKLYVRRDVNNYLAITTDGKVKAKGVFNPEMYLNVEKAYHFPIVSKALYNYYVDNVDFSETIKNSKDILDFCTAPRVGRQFEIQYITYNDRGLHETNTLQRTNRYFVSNGGGKLVKKEPNKLSYTELESRETVTILNDISNTKPFDSYRIKYQYYINHARKIIEASKDIESQLQLPY